VTLLNLYALYKKTLMYVCVYVCTGWSKNWLRGLSESKKRHIFFKVTVAYPQGKGTCSPDFRPGQSSHAKVGFYNLKV